MMPQNHTELAGLDAVIANLSAFCQHAYDGLARVSLSLDSTLGSDVTTGLAIVLGIVSLALALIPFWSAWQRPDPALIQPAPEAIQRNALGEEIVQMHPECLQTLYGLPPIPASDSVEVPVQAATVQVEPPEPAMASRHDVPLGLMADLSEEITQQHKVIVTLQLLVEQQQRQIDSLALQMKAQSSAFLLQGERLLSLEARTGDLPEQEPEEAANKDVQRMSSFDQAIEQARQGASVEALMSRCGLSVSEARLVVLVHGKLSAE